MQQPDPGIPVALHDQVRLLLAPNPGPMTHWGTNTYILGRGHVAVIDPGPDSPAHLAAILRATENEVISHILVTHAHADHSPLARRLSEVTGAPVSGFGPAEAGRSTLMAALAETDVLEGGEGRDEAFQPDVLLSNGDKIAGEDWRLDVLHSPGHFAGHLSFVFDGCIFSGDHVMDWSSTLISPPDGDLGAFMATCETLKSSGAARLYPGHGGPIDAVEDRLNWLINHRLSREASILRTLSAKPLSLQMITERVYTDVPRKVLPAAARNVFAHLIDLVERNLITATPRLSTKAQFHIR